jgi:hypothetical protein
MKILLQQDMEANIWFINGLKYDPGIYSSNDEILQLAKVVTPFSGDILVISAAKTDISGKQLMK